MVSREFDGNIHYAPYQAVVPRGLPDQTPRPFHAVQNPTSSDITSATDMSHAVSHIFDLLYSGASPCDP